VEDAGSLKLKGKVLGKPVWIKGEFGEAYRTWRSRRTIIMWTLVIRKNWNLIKS